MCGLAGVIRNTQQQFDWLDVYDTIDKFEEILVNAQSRGRHASGYAVINDDGFTLYKRPIAANELIKTEKHQELMNNFIGYTTHAIIGHTRYATQGTPQVSYNNHPIRIGSIIGTHNGSIWNDDQLAKQNNIIRNGQVDSEVLFQIIENCNLSDFINCKLPTVNGLISSVWTDIDEPNIIYVLKGNKPLSMVYNKKLDSYFYASLEEHLGDLEFCKVVDLQPNTLNVIDTNGLNIKEYNINFKSKRPQKRKSSFVHYVNSERFYNGRTEHNKKNIGLFD